MRRCDTYPVTEARDSNHDAHALARERVLVRCAMAWSIVRGARVAGHPIDPCCEEALFTLERWCRGEATASDVRTAAREATLWALDLHVSRDSWRARTSEAVRMACEEARLSLDGLSVERSSQMGLG
jgi:hypothetical protein